MGTNMFEDTLFGEGGGREGDARRNGTLSGRGLVFLPLDLVMGRSGRGAEIWGEGAA